MNTLPYNIDKISRIVDGKIYLKDPEKTLVQQLSTDSRKVINPEATLFFAIKGDRNDGHLFITDMFKRGVNNFVVSDYEEKYKELKANFIVVEDSLEALQKLSAYHRRQFAIPVVAITGSNGKTVVKEWLYQLLSQDQNIVRSPKSFNSQVGVPLSVWQMKVDNEIAIFEAGISKPGEMEKLQTIIHPQIGIFTNIGQAHAENFESIEQKVQEKLKLFPSTKILIYNKDYPALHSEIEKYYKKEEGPALFTWSRKTKSDLQVARVEKKEYETEIQGIYKNNFINIKIPFTDEASIENAIHCWSFMLYWGYSNDTIAERMELLSPVAMRLEMKKGINNCSIINDSYNSDIGSLTIALDFLNQQNQNARKTLILSDILQSGRFEDNLYSEVAELIINKKVDRLIGIGPAISRQAPLFEVDKSFFRTTDDFLNTFSPVSFKDETILLKGARTFGFERISQMIQQKTHETVLEINLNAIIHNLNYFRSKVKPGTKFMVMVKAFSYGSGSFEIANTLQFHNVDYLSVAYADEGMELRQGGITIPIMVMNPEEQSLETMIHHKLEPEVYSFRTLNSFTAALERRSKSTAFIPFPIHIELETGMHRTGFEDNELNELIVRIKNNKLIKINSVFTHLAASEDPAHDGFTKMQIDRFKKMSEEITSRFDYPIMKHALNSSGILRFPDHNFDMVRLGIGIYGIASTEADQKKLQNVGTLKTTISQIKNVSPKETVGYSRKGVVKRESQIATVSIGYADGLSRRLSNGVGKMYINGKLAPVIGNICMDMCMLDITDIPAKEADEVIVFGQEYPITQIAKELGTIPYELLTNISQRVKRVYYHE
ncbi:MAG: bifunctional UDP-N-acetylmuramoyl-tripeptide:D-alanyl-D-alanine ligase/alanine racemase [Bacteroidia bacterium]